MTQFSHVFTAPPETNEQTSHINTFDLDQEKSRTQVFNQKDQWQETSRLISVSSTITEIYKNLLLVKIKFVQSDSEPRL